MKRIAAVKTGAIGDLIQTTPALSALRKKYPNDEITLFCGIEYSYVLQNHHAIDRIQTFRSSNLYGLKMLSEAMRLAISLKKFDKVYIFHTDKKWLITSRFIGAECSVRQKDVKRHIWHLKTVGTDVDFIYSFNPAECAAKLPPKTYIAVAAGGGRNFRRHTPQRIWDKQAELALKIVLETKYSVALLGTTEDRLDVRHPKIFDYTGRTSLSDCFHIIDNAKRYVGCDSGLTHLAACTKTPMTVLFGPTNPKEAMPPVEADIVMSPRPCSPCDIDGIPACGSNLCMRDIEVDDVFNTVIHRNPSLRSE